MMIGADTVAGSVSGGCVESDVYETGKLILEGAPPIRGKYGVSDADAHSVGLTCGGEIDIFLSEINQFSFPELKEVVNAVAEYEPVAIALVVAGSDVLLGRRLVVTPRKSFGSTGCAEIDKGLAEAARQSLVSGDSQLIDCSVAEGEIQVFIEAIVPMPRLLIFGATEFASALARMATAAKYRVTVCDARSAFTTRERFPEADDIVVDWPHRYLAAESAAGRIDSRTAVCVLTHDPKFEVPLLELALGISNIGYIGVMGSRRTHADRAERLAAAGVTADEQRKMSSPLGLDIGATSPTETAISILAEIIASRSGRSGRRLKNCTGPIHNARVDESAFARPGCPDGYSTAGNAASLDIR
jgi:xanthine dehydrogenase accessory factor